MDAVWLARLQFAFTAGFHYLFPPLSIGLGLGMVIFEGLWLATGRAVYKAAAKFWTRIFGLIFALGVVSGIVLEFQFGTNWAAYSRFAGDVFGSPLAAEAIFAFFLESSFLGVLLYGWDRLGRRLHFFSALMVCLGAHLSAFWIVAANSWMQTPAGYHIAGEGAAARAEITDFWAMVFNPSTGDRIAHVLIGCWLSGAFLLMAVGAHYLLKRKHHDFATLSLKTGLVLAAVSSLLQLATGHMSAQGVAKHQPVKLAAFEGHYPEYAPADLYLFGWVDEEAEKTHGVKIPGMLSWLVYFDREKPLRGLRFYRPENRPPVNLTFQTYHAMVAIGLAMTGLSFLGLLGWRRGFLFRSRILLHLCVLSVLLPVFANELGWISAEAGRQPWLVWNQLRTSEGVSAVVSGGEVLFTLIFFIGLYLVLLGLFLFALYKIIQTGPEEEAAKPPPPPPAGEAVSLPRRV